MISSDGAREMSVDRHVPISHNQQSAVVGTRIRGAG